MGILYYCDSLKNTTCPKTICLYEGRGRGDMVCFATEHRKFARLGEDENPLIFDRQEFKKDAARQSN